MVHLHAIRMEKVMLDNNPQDKINEKEPTLFHILKMLKRRETLAIHQVQDPHSNTITTPKDIICTSVTHLRKKYGPIPVDSNCVATMMKATRPTCPTTWADCFERPNTPLKSSQHYGQEAETKR